MTGRARRLSAHIGYLFNDIALKERPAAARRAGFDAVEHPQPFAVPAVEMAAIIKGEGLTFAQLAAGNGDAAKGEKGIAALPGREAEFRESFLRSIDYAETVGAPYVHPMAGVAPKDADAATVSATYLANLAFAVEACRGRDCSVLVEAISGAAVPGYHIATLSDVLKAADAVAPSEIFVLLDTFHASCNGEDPADFASANVARIGHVHIADHPGRHEPGTGTLQFVPFLATLIAQDYSGAIGFEYIPTAGTEAGLGWMPSWQKQLGQDQ
ncbi:MAG: TIM barrel protein [Bauldia sp.]